MQILLQIFAIVKRELRAWFDHPTGYLLVIVALVFNAFFYFQSLAVNPVASLRQMFDLLPWLLMFLVPAVTMRLVAEERKSGTLETALSQPVSPWTYLGGKLCAAWFFFLLTLGLTLFIPLTLSPYGSFDAGVIAGQYLGAALLALAFAAVGLMASAATRHQVTAFLTSVGINFVFVIVGFEVVTVTLPGGLRFIAEHLSVFGHYANVTRGVLDLRDALYFLTLTAGAFALGLWWLMRDRLAAVPNTRRLRIGVFLMLALFVGLNLLGSSIRGRLDFTANNLYTLSPATKSMLGEVKDIVRIKLFVSKELPPQIALVQRDVMDMLNDFRAHGRGDVSVERKVAEEGSEAASEARALGVSTVQFNVFKKGAFEAQAGMFGLAIEYAGSHETIPFIERSDDLEYRLLRSLRKLTQEKKPTVALAMGHGEKAFEEIRSWRTAMGEFYTVKDLDLSATSTTIDADTDALIIAGPTRAWEAGALQTLYSFVESGGKVLAMLDQTEVSPQLLTARALPQDIGAMFAKYGVSVAPRLLADLEAHETVSLQSGVFSLFLPYPFWVKATVVKSHPLVGDLPTAVFPWPSPIETSGTTAGVKVEDVLVTSAAGVVQSPPFSIDPKERMSVRQDDLGTYALAKTVIVEEAGGKKLAAPGRIVLVGDADFVRDQFMREGYPNLAFALNALDWLMQDERLLQVRAKSRLPKPLGFPPESKRLMMVRYLNLVGVPVVVALGAGVRLFIRRRRTIV